MANIDKFMKNEGINTINTINDEKDFSPAGCDACNDGLGTEVYECHGYNPTTKEILDGYKICHECLCLYANGE